MSMKADVPNIKSSQLFIEDMGDMSFDVSVNNRCFLYSVRSFDHWENHGMQQWWDHQRYQLNNHPYAKHFLNIK